jgi:hypothetical protein
LKYYFQITHILAFSGNLLVLLRIQKKLIFFFQCYESFTKSFTSHELLGDNNVFANNVPLRGANRQILKSPKVLETAKNYFKCPTMVGVELENDGGNGSAEAHWERTILHNELMTASSITDASYSVFTLSLLQDSGLYQVDFDFSLAE